MRGSLARRDSRAALFSTRQVVWEADEGRAAELASVLGESVLGRSACCRSCGLVWVVGTTAWAASPVCGGLGRKTFQNCDTFCKSHSCESSFARRRGLAEASSVHRSSGLHSLLVLCGLLCLRPAGRRALTAFLVVHACRWSLRKAGFDQGYPAPLLYYLHLRCDRSSFGLHTESFLSASRSAGGRDRFGDWHCICELPCQHGRCSPMQFFSDQTAWCSHHLRLWAGNCGSRHLLLCCSRRSPR